MIMSALSAPIYARSLMDAVLPQEQVRGDPQG